MSEEFGQAYKESETVGDEAAEELSDEQMADIAGGFQIYRVQTKNGVLPFMRKIVSGADHGSELALHRTPNGAIMYGHGFKIGEAIFINSAPEHRDGVWVYCYSRKLGCAFGYVNSTLIR